ncbi:HIT family protein [Rhizorhapis suberifaciens]|uniref:Diadenosine tetraphosphate (Ap4A) HIT family hydrolase n=1 Tax=Rhizorhapis suberifaciens TaxID=13656 RepID=A0A840HTT7_9SPHN|nr:HIT family protein [Rhizorhapis suberifaciens]MBB4641111.1 diadenosine tetraphosphate (Ap4A) HIT family hydrolase [Rhizorhapis suberifaciens]
MNETIRNFGYPATLVHEYVHWVALVRPAQLTLGSLILAAKSDATDFSELAPEAFVELKQVTADLTAALTKAVSHAKINYLMLMMVDPHVHFHVLPRYDGERSAAGLTLADASWPGPPDLSQARKLNEDETPALVAWLKGYWRSR